MGSLMRTVGPYAGTLFANTTSDIERYAQEMLTRNIKPEMEVYHHGMLREVNNLISKNLVKKPYYINLVLGMAYQGAVAGTPENLFSLKQLLPLDCIFNCCAVGPAQFPMTTLSMILGGNARVAWKIMFITAKGCWPRAMPNLQRDLLELSGNWGWKSPPQMKQGRY